MLELEGVSLSFGGLRAIDGLDLRVPDGTVCSLIGPNGAGKTSVLNVINRYHTPQAGRVSYNGTDLLRLPPHRVVEAGIARSFQSPALFRHLSVLDNLLVGATHLSSPTLVEDVLRLPRSRRHERDARQRAERTLAFLRLEDVRHRIAGDLSYGHQKLVDMGRALVANPTLLLLDEPAAGMEEGQKLWLAEVIARIPGEYGAAVLLIDHDMGLVLGVSARVVVMNFGSKIFEGPPGEVRQQPLVLAAYLGTEAAGAEPGAPARDRTAGGRAAPDGAGHDAQG
jgi:branched-chain amino acid transport system ATP-binding protein